jgi:hypothetical protein
MADVGWLKLGKKIDNPPRNSTSLRCPDDYMRGSCRCLTSTSILYRSVDTCRYHDDMGAVHPASTPRLHRHEIAARYRCTTPSRDREDARADIEIEVVRISTSFHVSMPPRCWVAMPSRAPHSIGLSHESAICNWSEVTSKRKRGLPCKFLADSQRVVADYGNGPLLRSVLL